MQRKDTSRGFWDEPWEHEALVEVSSVGACRRARWSPRLAAPPRSFTDGCKPLGSLRSPSGWVPALDTQISIKNTASSLHPPPGAQKAAFVGRTGPYGTI